MDRLLPIFAVDERDFGTISGTASRDPSHDTIQRSSSSYVRTNTEVYVGKYLDTALSTVAGYKAGMNILYKNVFNWAVIIRDV